MACDIMTQFYSCLNLPLQERILELTRLIDRASPNKDLQAIFPQLVSNIFAPYNQNGWNLRQVTFETNRYEYQTLLSFLEPLGPMFRLCYKLLSDTQLKYNLPLNTLPIDLQITLERGRCPQFYADLLATDSQSMNVVALALITDPFDYYIFHFALYLVNNNQNKALWENWNSVYFALACDYLLNFLPSDPNIPVLPHIPHYTGKVPMAAPLQTANRPLYSPSLLLIPDLSGMSNQHTTSQTQSRNEVWRSETVLQVFIDLWMSVEQFSNRSLEMYERNYSSANSSPERVRIVRVLVKHIHSFSAKYNSDPAIRSSALRKYARQIMCSRAYHYIKHLVMTWPLDASFRLVMELWLSLIQPWRYTNSSINQDRFPASNQEEGNSGTLDASYTQFIAENFPSYTCIFQLILPRFMRLDLSAYKNAVMLFRLGKVFSQQHLVPILLNLEKAIRDNISGLQTLDNSYNNSNLDQSYTYNGIALNKWVAIAKQAISELNMTATFEYDPVWSDSKKNFTLDFVKRILSAKHAADKNLENYVDRLGQQNKGIWNSVKHWLMIGNTEEESMMLEEYKKVPNYLTSCVNFFSNIFGLNENMLLPLETEVMDNSTEHSSLANSNNFNLSIAQKLRNKPTGIQYMGDPDLMPIMSYENTILVRIFYQIATRLNEMYGEEFTKLWRRNDLLGYITREVLQKPLTIQTYVKDESYHQNIVYRDLPPRLSLRRLASHVLVVWVILGYIMFRMLSYNGIFYAFFLIMMWSIYVISRASFKILRIINE